MWQASRVHVSFALEMHEEHLFTAHHGLIGHTCGSSACRLLSSVLTEASWEASPWDRNLTLSFSPVPDSSVWPTSNATSTARIHPHLDTTESTATSQNGITTHALTHGLIKSTLRGFDLSSPCRVFLPPRYNWYNLKGIVHPKIISRLAS